ncbi:MAG: hypothetical protein ABI889_08355 [Gemmatimonadota bacterium]
MRVLVLAVITSAYAMLACAPATSRPDLQPLGASSVDQVIAQYYEAVGGYDRLKGVRTRHMRGRYHEGSLDAVTEIFHERPHLRRVSVLTAKWEHIEGFDGQTWEYHRDVGHATGHLVRDTLGGPAELAQRRGSEFDESFIDYAQRGFAATLVGRERLRDLDVFRVRITRNDGWVLEYYFDVHSHLLVALRKAMPLHAEGPNVESLTFYSDWRFVSGLLVPFSGEEQDVRTGAVMSALTWEVIEHNVPIKREEILPPKT